MCVCVCVYGLKRLEINVFMKTELTMYETDFLSNSPLIIQYTYSREVPIGRSTHETYLLI